MDLSSHAGDIPIPINTSYAHGHSTHHDHPAAIPHNQVISSSNNNNGPSITASIDDHHHHGPYNKKTVRYKECLKNHAAAMGGNAADGCGEFMPSGDDGSIEALTCLACNCHRNFHRKETEGDTASSSCDCYHSNPHFSRIGRKVVLSHHNNIFSPEALGYHPAAGTLIPSRVNVAAPHPHQMIMPYSMASLPSESDEQEDGGGVLMSRPPRLAKKRFRTKFTQEQKEKMLNFAEKVGWKMQRQEEAMVQQFCQEIGVKRRVLKVWMHNNKHNLAKKNVATPTTTTTTTTTT